MKRIFSLAEARELLPTVRELTTVAVKQAEDLAGELQALDAALEDAPADASSDALGGLRARRERLAAQLNAIATGWAAQMRELGLEAKGLWLVDFDNGSGYYCWKHPEPTLQHFHDYDTGFAGRMRIV